MGFAVYGLSKAYGGVEVLKGVDLTVADGEIHALLGANGAGKSTLIKCLSGAITADDGVMMVGDHRYRAFTPKGARQAGIAVIYQDLSLALSLDVADNIFLGQELRFGPFIRYRAQRAEAARWLDELGVGISPREDLSRLGNASLQAIEIIKALRARPRVLILDEPTAALSEREAAALGEHLIQLKNQKLPVLYVTHRLGEVFALADRVTVLRGGAVALTGRVDELDRDQIVSAIAGQGVGGERRGSSGTSPRPRLLDVRGLVSAGIGPVSFDVRQGEVLGVFGLVGSGRTEMLETLFGAREMSGGTVTLNEERLPRLSPPSAVAAGIALVPSDRLRKSIFASLRSDENVLLPSYRLLDWMGLRRPGNERSIFGQAAKALHLHPERSDLEARRFSGGNQQKLVIARWLNALGHCRLLLLDEPTQGVDVGARKEIYDALRAAAADGRSVVVTSSEPEELVQIADRVMVLSGGRLAAILDGERIDEARMLSLAHSMEHGEVAAA